ELSAGPLLRGRPRGTKTQRAWPAPRRNKFATPARRIEISPMPRLCLLLVLFALGVSRLAAASLQEDVRAADTRRVMATIAGDADRVAELLSDDLRYGHADGRVQTKDEFLAAVRSSRMRYEAYD